MSEKAEKLVTHVTREQFVNRHLYCVTLQEIRDAMARGEYTPKNAKAVCDHPEDGVCGTWISDETLTRVNERLAARAGKEPSAQPTQPAAAVSEKQTPTEATGKPKRGLPAGLQEYLRKKREAKEAS